MKRLRPQRVHQDGRFSIIVESSDYGPGEPAGKALVWREIGIIEIDISKASVDIGVSRIDEAYTGPVRVEVV